MKSIWRYEIPADDQWHEVNLTSVPLHAAMVFRSGGFGVEFWAERSDGPEITYRFQVFGTGYPIPDNAVWWATCDRGVGGLVFHLYEDPS